MMQKAIAIAHWMLIVLLSVMAIATGALTVYTITYERGRYPDRLFWQGSGDPPASLTGHPLRFMSECWDMEIQTRPKWVRAGYFTCPVCGRGRSGHAPDCPRLPPPRPFVRLAEFDEATGVWLGSTGLAFYTDPDRAGFSIHIKLWLLCILFATYPVAVLVRKPLVLCLRQLRLFLVTYDKQRPISAAPAGSGNQRRMRALIHRSTIALLTTAAGAMGFLAVAERIRFRTRPFEFTANVRESLTVLELRAGPECDVEHTWSATIPRVLNGLIWLDAGRGDTAIVATASTGVWPLAWAALFAGYPAFAFAAGPLRRYRRHHRGLCVACGYNLKGLTEPRCPECGREFAPCP